MNHFIKPSYRTPFFILVCFLFVYPFATNAITVEISATVPGCGDGIINFGEQCDGNNLGGASCASLNYSEGVLSCTNACVFKTSSCTISQNNNGKGSLVLPFIPYTNVVFTGKAYPLSKVTLLKNSEFSSSTIANSKGDFQINISNISGGYYIFSVYFENKNGKKSTPLTFPLNVTQGVTTKIGEIFIEPIFDIKNNTEDKLSIDNVDTTQRSNNKVNSTVSLENIYSEADIENKISTQNNNADNNFSKSTDSVIKTGIKHKSVGLFAGSRYKYAYFLGIGIFILVIFVIFRYKNGRMDG